MRRNDSVSRTAGFITGMAWRVILIAAIIFLLLQGIRVAYSYGHGLFYEHALAGAGAPEQAFVITDGESLDRLAKDLEEAGLIDNRQAFVLQAHLYELEIEPGSYTLSPSMTEVDIIEHLSQEGTKNKELADKNLLAAQESTAAAEETGADGTEIVGGTEDENLIQQDAARAMTTADSEEKNP